MKKKIFLAVIFGAMFLAQGAGAKSLEEILKEKGVISDSEYKEATKSKVLDYKLGRGVTIRPSDQFQLTIGGQITPRYTYTDNSTPTKGDSSEFRMRYAKMWMTGFAYTKDLTYTLQAEFENANSSKFVELAYLNYRVVDEFQVQPGEAKVLFGRQWLASAAALEFVDRSIVSDTFRPGYDTGAVLWGNIYGGRIVYGAGVTGGVGQNTLRTNDRPAYNARVVLNPFGYMGYSEADIEWNYKPLLSIGANYWHDTLKLTFTPAVPNRTVLTPGGGTTVIAGTPASSTIESNNLNLLWLSGTYPANLAMFNRTENLNIDMYGIDAAFKWRGFFALAEYLEGRAKGDDSGKALRSYGWYAQAGYFILPTHLEVAVRYSYLNPNTNISKNLNTQFQGAVSYYFFGHNLKIQADYTNINDRAVGGTSGNVYRLQTNILF